MAAESRSAPTRSLTSASSQVDLDLLNIQYQAARLSGDQNRIIQILAQMENLMPAAAGGAGGGGGNNGGRGPRAPPPAIVSDTTPAERIAADAAKGGEFERAALQGILGHIGLGKNTTVTPQVLAGGTTVNTIVDMSGKPAGLVEFKNFRYLSRSRQLRGLIAHAERDKVPFNLVVSPTTQRLSGPLLDAIAHVTRRYGGGIYRYDPATDTLTP